MLHIIIKLFPARPHFIWRVRLHPLLSSLVSHQLHSDLLALSHCTVRRVEPVTSWLSNRNHQVIIPPLSSVLDLRVFRPPALSLPAHTVARSLRFPHPPQPLQLPFSYSILFLLLVESGPRKTCIPPCAPTTCLARINFPITP